MHLAARQLPLPARRWRAGRHVCHHHLVEAGQGARTLALPSHTLARFLATPPSHPSSPLPALPSTLQFEAVIFDHVYDEELGNITGHFGPINTLAFAPHGRSYASGGEDGYVRITHFPEVYFDAFSKKTAEAFDRPWPEKK